MYNIKTEGKSTQCIIVLKGIENDCCDRVEEIAKKYAMIARWRLRKNTDHCFGPTLIIHTTLRGFTKLRTEIHMRHEYGVDHNYFHYKGLK